MRTPRPDPSWRTVYSTDPDAAGPEKKDAADPKKPAAPAPLGALRLRLEKKGRAGKAVTVVAGATGSPEYLNDLARSLKALCGAGGTLKSAGGTAEIEIQGDQRPKVEARLRELGYKVKRAGG